MLLYPFPTQSRPAPPHPTGIAERASFHTDLEKPRSRLHLHLPDNPGRSRASEATPEKARGTSRLRISRSMPGERSDARPHNEPASDPCTSHAERAKRCSYPTKGPSMQTPSPSNPETQGAPVSTERFRSNSAKPNCEDQRRGNRGARWEQNGLLTRGAAAACAARYRRVGAADAQSGRGIRDEDGPPPPRAREPRAYQDDRARSCPSRPPR